MADHIDPGVDKIVGLLFVSELFVADKALVEKARFARADYRVGLDHKRAAHSLARAGFAADLEKTVIVPALDMCFERGEFRRSAVKRPGLDIDRALPQQAQTGLNFQNDYFVMDKPAEPIAEDKPDLWVVALACKPAVAEFERAVAQPVTLVDFPKLVIFSYWQKATAHWPPS